MGELEALHIDQHDTLGSDTIEILIDADVAGMLFTGRRYILTCGSVAVETLLGWTIMERIPRDLPNCSTTLTVHSLFVKEASVTKLWKIDVLGIKEPSERQSRHDLANEAKQLLLKLITVDYEGRYKVRLP
ncbi:hypothetical protein JTB14_027375 [Gonioctena quinquepunctata]|nr:hypothetical protein JTB14_027375 [Gonioctena quinquepunctata]